MIFSLLAPLSYPPRPGQFRQRDRGRSPRQTTAIALVGGLITGIASLFGAIVPAAALPLSPGDRIRVSIPEEGFLPNEATVSGVYELDFDGSIVVPYVGRIAILGFETEDVQRLLRERLINAQLFQEDFLQLVVAPISWGPVRVNVRGAVFRPGQVTANPIDTLNNPSLRGPLPNTGNFAPQRELIAALGIAGGVTPNADLAAIKLIRGEVEIPIDLTGIVTGEGAERTPLIDGDTIVVPELSSGIDPRLLRPSSITPQTVTVFFSNLSQPAAGGGLANLDMEYGMRFSNAVVVARCVGGNRIADAHRRVAHIRTNRYTGKTDVTEVSIEKFLKQELNDEAGNPVLMPGDGIICYDGTVPTVRSFLSIVGDVLNPIDLLRRMFFDSNN